MSDKLKFGVDTRKKALQWGFTMSSFDDAVVDRLSNLPPEVLYVTFAICDDDAGSQYLQGFVKTTRRSRVSRLRSLIGPACFSILKTQRNVADLLVEIRLNSYSEFGDTWVLDNWVLHRRGGALDMFKRDVVAGMATDKLFVSHADTCVKFPGLVNKYKKSTPSPLPPEG